MRIVPINTVQINNKNASQKSDARVTMPSFKSRMNSEAFVEYAKRGDVGFIRRAVEEGIDVNSTNKFGFNAISLAIIGENDAVIDYLLTVPGINLHLLDRYADRQGDASLVYAIFQGYKNVCKKILETMEFDINARSKYGMTALTEACWRNYDDIVEMILQRPDIDVNKPTWYNSGTVVDPPLHLSIDQTCKYDTSKVAKMLIDRPDYNINAVNYDGDTALMHACRELNVAGFTNVRDNKIADVNKIIRMILERSDVDLDIKNRAGYTALDIAKKAGNAEAVWMIRNAKNKEAFLSMRNTLTSDNFNLDKDIKTLSYEELKSNQAVLLSPDLFKQLIDHENFNPNDKFGMFTLFNLSFATDGTGKLAEMILSKYDDVDTKAAEFFRNDIIDRLISEYESVGKYQLKLEKFKRNLMKPKTREDAVERFKKYIMSEEFKPEHSDKLGNTSLHIIAGVPSSDSRGLIAKLLSKGVDINAKNISKRTPLMAAIRSFSLAKSNEEKEILLSNIKFLLDNGADINAKDSNEQTALHYACCTTSVALLNLILSREPNLLAKDLKGNVASKYIKNAEMKNLYSKLILGEG